MKLLDWFRRPKRLHTQIKYGIQYVVLADLPGYDIFENCGICFLRGSEDEDDGAVVLYSREKTLEEIQACHHPDDPDDEHKLGFEDFSELIESVKSTPTGLMFKW